MTRNISTSFKYFTVIILLFISFSSGFNLFNRRFCIYNSNPTSFNDISTIKENVPRHIAYIVDGNGRWAIANNMSRLDGHNAGDNKIIIIFLIIITLYYLL